MSAPVASMASTSPASGAQSLSNAPSNWSPSRTDMIAMPWRPRSPLSRITSPGCDPGGRDFHARRDPADAGRVDEDAVAFAAIDDLRVAGDDPHAGRSGGLGHRGHDAAERFHRQALFEDEARAEICRPGPGHRQVVDGSVDGQLADVAAGEEQRADDEPVGGEGQPGPAAGSTAASCGGAEILSTPTDYGPWGSVARTPAGRCFRSSRASVGPRRRARLNRGMIAQRNGATQVEVVVHGCFLCSISSQTSRTSCHSCGETSWGWPNAICRSRSSGLPP